MIQLRDVLQNELSSLDELCLRSKAVWGYDDAFMTACRTELTLRPDELLSTHLQVAERDTTVVGLAQIKVTGTDADLLKLFVEPVQLRSGVGRLLFEWAAARARGLGAVRMIIEADPDATYRLQVLVKRPNCTRRSPKSMKDIGRPRYGRRQAKSDFRNRRLSRL